LPLGQELIFANPTLVDTPTTVKAWPAGKPCQGCDLAIDAAIVLPDGRPACQCQSLVRPADQHPGYGQPSTAVEALPASEAQTYRHLAIGQRASVQKTYSEEDRRAYTALTGDANPLWHDADSARRAGLGHAMVPGPLLSSLFSQLLGTRLPGRGTNWLKQKLRFFAPARWNETITATVELVRLRPDKHLANLNGVCTDSRGTVVCQARSLVLVKDIEDKK